MARTLANEAWETALRDRRRQAATGGQYRVDAFVAWLEQQGSGVVAAARVGCKDIRTAARSQETVSEETAIQWAGCYGADVDEIWGQGPKAKIPVALTPLSAGIPAAVPLAKPPPTKVRSLPEETFRCPVPACRKGFGTAHGLAVHTARKHKFGAPVVVSAPVRTAGVAAPAKPAPSAPPTPALDMTKAKGAMPYYPPPKAAPSDPLAIASAIAGHDVAPGLGFTRCPLCTVWVVAKAGLRNHIRNAHHRDPDELLGPPAYRAKGGLAAKGRHPDVDHAAVLAELTALGSLLGECRAMLGSIERHLAALRAGDG